MKNTCIYPQVRIQMILNNWDNRDLAEKTQISYNSICKKLSGHTKIPLEDAIKIKDVLGCDLSLEELFKTKEFKTDANS